MINRLLFSIFMLGALTACNAQEAPQGGDVNVVDAAKLIESEELTVIDVRTPEELANLGYIDGALNLNFKGKDFKEKLEELPKDKPYLVYCHVGGRSSRAMKMMKKMGFETVYNLDGGIMGWKENGNPVKQ